MHARRLGHLDDGGRAPLRLHHARERQLRRPRRPHRLGQLPARDVELVHRLDGVLHRRGLHALHDLGRLEEVMARLEARRDPARARLGRHRQTQHDAPRRPPRGRSHAGSVAQARRRAIAYTARPMPLAPLVYRWPSALIPATFERRYERFLADVRLDDGSPLRVHCVNPGRMEGLVVPGARVWLSRATTPGRTLTHTWEIIELGGVLVGRQHGPAQRGGEGGAGAEAAAGPGGRHRDSARGALWPGAARRLPAPAARRRAPPRGEELPPGLPRRPRLLPRQPQRARHPPRRGAGGPGRGRRARHRALHPAAHRRHRAAPQPPA